MIQIIAGVYGRKMADGSVKAMDKNSGPFNASPEQEERLIRLGLAVRVDHVVEVELEELTAKELRDVGKQYGITFKANASKSVMIDAIKAAQTEGEAEEDDGEDAPVFDASEAVL